MRSPIAVRGSARIRAGAAFWIHAAILRRRNRRHAHPHRDARNRDRDNAYANRAAHKCSGGNRQLLHRVSCRQRRRQRSWTSACLSANPPNARPYYAHFYTFALSAPDQATIILSSSDASP